LFERKTAQDIHKASKSNRAKFFIPGD